MTIAANRHRMRICGSEDATCGESGNSKHVLRRHDWASVAYRASEYAGPAVTSAWVPEQTQEVRKIPKSFPMDTIRPHLMEPGREGRPVVYVVTSCNDLVKQTAEQCRTLLS
jgi:hypothetical protein